MNKFLPSAILSLLIASQICLQSCSNIEKSEAQTAEIEAAQMEGRTAAREFVREKNNDTTGTSRRLNKVRTTRAKYDTIGRSDLSAAYDSAFIRTIRAVNPNRAHRIQESY